MSYAVCKACFEKTAELQEYAYMYRILIVDENVGGVGYFVRIKTSYNMPRVITAQSGGKLFRSEVEAEKMISIIRSAYHAEILAEIEEVHVAESNLMPF